MQEAKDQDLGAAQLLFRSLSAERSRLRLRGPDARRFLHGMVSNDIQGLKPGQGCHAAQLTVKGKLLADLVVYDCGDAGLLIELVSSARAAVQGALDRHLIMDDATVEDLSDAIGELGVYGAGASEALSAITGTSATELAALPMYHFRPFSDGAEGAAPPAFIAATKELGMPGFHVIAGNAALDRLGAGLFSRGGRRLSDDEAEALRIEAGTPLYGIDIDEDRMPAEAGLDDAVSTTKGCYLGQEVVVRLRDRGHLNRKLCGLFFADDGAPPARGTLLRHEAKPNAGVITSAVASPRCGTIALGYVHRLAWEPGTVLELTSADGQPLGRTAQVAPLPFPRKTR